MALFGECTKPIRWLLIFATFTFPSIARATPIFEQISPMAKSYVFALGLPEGFTQSIVSGLGDVTANLQAVDIPSAQSPSTSGCEASDFSGFTAGSVALIERGSCTFDTKALNAAAAGASAVVIFNNLNNGSLNFADTISPGIPAIFTTLKVGSDLIQELNDGPVVVRVAVVSLSDIAKEVAPVPLPASAPMFGAALLGLAGLGCAAKCKKAAASA